MRRFRTLLAGMILAVAGITPFATPASAVTAEGKEWRQLYETTGLSWDQVATVCPTDGITPCSGSVGGKNLTGWVWGTESQVRGLMDDYWPGLADPTAPPPTGIEGFWAGVGFLGDMRWTTYTSLTYFYQEYTGGWTASKDANGSPIGGSGSYSHAGTGTTADGSLGLGSGDGAASSVNGVFLWRTPGLDYSPPVVSPNVTGTLGTNGWYRSNVNIAWSVTDAESTIVSSTGCDPADLAVDTTGVSYTCTATSAGFGGPGSGSITVKRDATAPEVVCGATPTYLLTQPNATVTATVIDARSGPVSPSLTVAVSTANPGQWTATVTGTDRAGNTRQQQCPYNVLVPTCNGKVATIRGTAGSDTIVGTASSDVIIGLSGNDTIDGGLGNDTICGGDSLDTIRGGGGTDKIFGGAGNDDLYGGDGGDDLNGGADSDSIRGDAGYDRCTSGEIRMSSCAVLY